MPEGWVWCRFPEIADLISGQDFPPEKYNSTAKGTPYIIGASNFEDGYLRISRWTESPSVLSRKGDVLVVCKGAGVGKMAVNDLGTVHIARQVQAVRIQNEIVSSDFMRILIDWCIPSIVSQANGLIPGLKRELLLNLILPIPPRCEQDRIVSTLSCALAILKRFEEEQTELERDIRKLRERILDLAIHGKLVPQDPSDEPAIELLKRINPDFVPSHNLHYDVCPNGWEVTQLKNIIELLSGRDLETAKCNSKAQGLPYLVGASCIDNANINIYRWTETPEVISKEGDVLLSCKGTVGEVVLNTLGNLHIARQFMAIRSRAPQYIQPEYLEIIIKASIDRLKNVARGIIPGISREDILDLTVMIPPFEEQKRILSRIANYNRLISLIVANVCD